jgi:Trypsin-co-occurring domain 1
MDKAIEVRGAHGVFLVETDASVVVPQRMTPMPSTAQAGRLPEGMRPVSSVTDLARDFSDVRELIVSCCTTLEEAMSRIKSPDRVAVEFGIKFAGEAGVPMLTKASGEATLKVSIEWKAATREGAK